MAAISVDTDVYVRGAQFMQDAQLQLRGLTHTLAGALAGTGTMAGDDQNGIAFAADYDSTVQQLAKALGQLHIAIGVTAQRLALTADDWAEVEAANSGIARPQANAVFVEGGAGPTVTPPSAHGGTAPPPPGWEWVLAVQSVVWPNGDTQRLKNTGAAWRAAGDSLSAIRRMCTFTTETQLFGMHSESAKAALKSVQELDALITELIQACQSAGDSADGFGRQIDQAHQEIRQEVTELLMTTAVMEGAAIALGLLTAGIGTAIAQVGVAARIGLTAARIMAIVARVTALLRPMTAALGTASRTAIRAGEGLARFRTVRITTNAAAKMKVPLQDLGALARTYPGATRAVQLGSTFAGSATVNLGVDALDGDIDDPVMDVAAGLIPFGFVAVRATKILGKVSVPIGARGLRMHPDFDAGKLRIMGLSLAEQRVVRHEADQAQLKNPAGRVHKHGRSVGASQLLTEKKDLPRGLGLGPRYQPLKNDELWDGQGFEEYSRRYFVEGELSRGLPVIDKKAWPNSFDHPAGFLSPEHRVPVELHPGYVFDRFGYSGGDFVAPAGSRFDGRGLPDTALFDTLHTYEVLHPLPAWAGSAAPAFGSAGGGIQFKLDVSIEFLMRKGYIKEIN